MRGRPPTPTPIKALRGNPGKRPLNAAEPRPPAARPTCPSWLSRDAKAEWRRIVPELEQVGLLTQVDRAALAAYCQSYARWRQAEAALDDGLRIELFKVTNEGEAIVYQVIQKPEVAIAQKERQLMKAFLTEFGLTPASRTRLKTPEKPVEDDFDSFMGRRGG